MTSILNTLEKALEAASPTTRNFGGCCSVQVHNAEAVKKLHDLVLDNAEALVRVARAAQSMQAALDVGHGDHGPNRCRLCDEIKAIRAALAALEGGGGK